MFSLYKKELQSYFLSPAAYAVLAFFTLTFSLTMIMDISAASSLYEFSFTSLFYTNLFLPCYFVPRSDDAKLFGRTKEWNRSALALQPD